MCTATATIWRLLLTYTIAACNVLCHKWNKASKNERSSLQAPAIAKVVGGFGLGMTIAVRIIFLKRVFGGIIKALFDGFSRT